MKIAYVSTYLPQQCGIATYLNYLIKAIGEADRSLEVKVVAERGAALLKKGKFEVIPPQARLELATR